MKKSITTALAVLIAIAQIQGCANMSQTEQGAAIGGVTGGVLGLGVAEEIDHDRLSEKVAAARPSRS